MELVNIGNLVAGIMSALFQLENGEGSLNIDFDKSWYSVPATDTPLGVNTTPIC